MASTLILVRHGKAKAIAPGQADIDRELTEAGKRSLSASLAAELAPLLFMKGRIEVWSSQATRALQTAEILYGALDECGAKLRGDILVNEDLWTQDVDALIECAREAQSDIVFAVGHNPMIEDTVAQLTGANLHIATGGIAAIGLSECATSAELTANERSDRLLWFSQGPISQHWKTLVQMEKILREGSDAIQDRLTAFMEDPDDIETLHKLRVSIRTLRSLVAFVKPWQDKRQNAELQENLKQVVAHTSKQRELDVFWEQCVEDGTLSDELVAFVSDAAAKERKRTMKALNSKDVAKRLKTVERETGSVRWKDSVVASGLSAAQVRKHFDEMVEAIQFDIDTLDLVDVETTHDVRKMAKRARYAAENFSPLIGEDTIAIAKGMTAHQDDLGAICDARVNIDMINELLELDLVDAVAWDLTLMRAKNETYLYSILRDTRKAPEQEAISDESDGAFEDDPEPIEESADDSEETLMSDPYGELSTDMDEESPDVSDQELGEEESIHEEQ